MTAPVKTVAITGGTRGIGLGLAWALLAAGHQVAVCGTNPERVEQVRAELPDRALVFVADVTDRDQLQKFWDAGCERFGRIDIWINNAGISHDRARAWELPATTAQAVVSTNLLGAMNGSAVAITGMAAAGGGHVWNMEGLGSDGRMVAGLGLYGATKRAVGYLSQALAKEAPEGVSIGRLSPGMVVTDLLLHGYSADELVAVKKVMNILADKVETVTPWLAEQVVSQTRNGAHVRWLTTPKIAARFAMAPIRKRDLFGDNAISA
ncbi:SDR family oxidoreductase [Nocardia higoensis]|uniref:SDR family oxidoreductase n=1 Tax=Nocardia higoensis TaxID=228599 RepID=UPI00031A1114|nr:SDR family NAD(P)-dependent oxidoreductase [Nocardia higoensis]